MHKKILIFLFCITAEQTLSGQCPDKVFLWNRIVFLRDSSEMNESDQLRELSTYLNKMNDCPPVNDSVNALLLARVGALLAHKNNLKEGIALTLKSINMIQSNTLNPAVNESHLIKYYNNLQIYYDSAGQTILKKNAVDSCINISLRLKTGLRFSVNHIMDKVEALFVKGDYYHCLELATIAEKLSNNTNYRPEDALYFACWEINSYLYLNRYKEAANKIESSLAECYKTGAKTYLGSLLGLKANLAEKNGTPEEANLFALQSFRFEKNAGNSSNCVSALSNLGQYLYFDRLRQYDKALYYYKEALKYANRNDSLYVLNNIANVYTALGDFNDAMNYFSQSFGKIHPGADEKYLADNFTSGLTTNWQTEYIFNLILDKGDSFLKKYYRYKEMTDLKIALDIYKTADRLLNKVNASQLETTSKLFWRTHSRRLYENAIESCYLSNSREDAFYFFEKSRATLLNDQLRERELSDPILLKMFSARKKIIDNEKRKSGMDSGTVGYANVENDLFTDKEELNQLDQSLKEKNPWYYQSLIDTNFLSLQRVQEKLFDKSGLNAILEFFNGDSALYVLFITEGSTSISRLNKKEFDKKVDLYTSYLSNPDAQNQDYSQMLKTGQELYKLIFKSIPVPDGRIAVSLDGKYFPMETLVVKQDGQIPEYFLNSHATSYTYSIRFLLNSFNNSTATSGGNFLGMAPVSFPAGFNLSPLSESDISIENIRSNISHSKSLVAGQASRENFMEKFYDYKIIQLYTHAADSSLRGEPIIYFADSALYLSDLTPENRSAPRLIVLSACETGNGKLYKGEGVFSFNRGFAAMGIPSSVTNLWSVDNQSTYQITELFYKYVAKGLALDVALQKAKLDFIAGSSKEKRLPYYWAPAILVGKTDSIEISSPMKWTRIIIPLLAVLTFVSILVLRRNKFLPKN